MSDQRQTVAPEAGWRDLPLPGFYPCLTWQLNVTLHTQQMASKWVSVLREPTDHVEIRRSFGSLGDWVPSREGILHHVSRSLADMDYLAGGRGI